MFLEMLDSYRNLDQPQDHVIIFCVSTTEL